MGVVFGMIMVVVGTFGLVARCSGKSMVFATNVEHAERYYLGHCC